MKSKKSFFFKNGLSLLLALFMLVSLTGQIYTGWKVHNDFLSEYGRPPQTLAEYFKSGHIIQATFENWESEFFQMGLFVIFTIFLRQKGSSESKSCEEDNFNASDLEAHSNSPWAVKKGGVFLSVYKHSLSIVLFLIFLLSFFLHWYGSWLDFNEKQLLENKSTAQFLQYLQNKKLWFESFENWHKVPSFL